MAAMVFGMTVQAQQPQLVDGIAAVVGKTIIRYSDIEQAYAQVITVKRLPCGNG